MTYSEARNSHNRHATQAYTRIGLQTQVLGANPVHLITLLFEGAQAAISKAHLYMQQGNIQERGNAISKAIEIVGNGLKASVNLEEGGELARNLVTVYDQVIHNLLLANLNSDPDKLVMAERLLANLGIAWRTAVDSPNHHAATPTPRV
ncbi:flagellar export chaperone FliS [Alcaligenaceae bacterium]|nr:flagellar export chaperone FliS [Alcaligenaceae bacterium]